MEVKRSWLVYSNSGDSVYCYCCKLFSETKSSLGKEGYRDWKNIAETLKQHERSPNHETSFLKWKELELRINNSKTIDHLNEKIIKTEIQHWRQVIERIISLIRVLGNQNLALRGTHDKLNVENNGNFLKFIEFLGQFDPVMKEHIRRITSDEIHTHYLGKEIQNEIINLLAKKIRLHILKCLKKAKYYSIVLDCTPDISNKEQMTMIFRFVTISEDTGEVTIAEHFVDFIQLYDTSGYNMTKTLLDKLTEFEVNLDDMRGQGYDNGSNMRGKHSGVQARILELNSRAFYVPCNAHTLNLVLNDSANCCLEAVSFFSLIQAIYNFFSSSTHRWDILIKYLPGLTVKPLSATRWESRVDAVKVIRFQLNEICDALSDIEENNTLTNVSSVKSRSEAQGILKNISNFKFVMCSVIWYDILYEINISSKLLQSPSLDLSEAITQLNTTKKFLEDYRSEGFEKALKTSKEIAKKVGIDDKFDSSQRSRSKGTLFSPEMHFKVNFFNQVLDTGIQSIIERFGALSEHNSLFSFLYNVSIIEDENELLKHCKDLQLSLTSNDGLNTDISAVELHHEIIAFRRCSRNEQSDPRKVLEYICKRKMVELFPNLVVALKILLTLPITAASAERSFSKLKIIKNYLRSQICQIRLVGLATLSIEKDLSNKLDMEEIVQEFAALKARKIKII